MRGGSLPLNGGQWRHVIGQQVGLPHMLLTWINATSHTLPQTYKVSTEPCLTSHDLRRSVQAQGTGIR
jgi:hypothetical protein